MSLYLDTRGKSSLAIGICGRCSRKYSITELSPDPNIPGLMVCGNGCKDSFDPYRLPARQPENLALRFARPDISLATDPYGLISEDGNYFFTDESGDYYLVP